MADFRPYSVSTAGLSRVNGFLSTLKLPPIVPGEQILDQHTDDSRFPVPHTDTYAGKYNTVNKTYYTFFDEALRDSQENSLAMGRSGFLYALRRQRQYPSVSLPHDFELDDPEDAEQKHVAADLLNIFKYIKRFNSIKMWLSEAHYFGKSAVQVKIAPHRIAGRVRNTVRAFMPVNGDKLRYHFDGTPGVAIYAGDMDRYKRMFGDDFVGMTTQGPALFLRNAFLRDRFVIHNFEPSDTDYLFESDMAQAVHGIGLRSRLYWDWQILTELLSWHFDALQRVGVNGMLIGLARSGNSRMVAAVTKALIDLQKDNVCVFEIDDLREGMKAEDFIHRIEPAQIGYEVLFEMIKYFANNIREGFLGHGDVSKSNGLNDGTANFYSDTFQYIVTFDATDLEETINDELKPTLLKHNFFEYRGKTYKGDQLPFDLRFKFQIDKKNIKDLMESAQRIFQMGGKLDVEDLRDQAGLKAPKEDANALVLGPHGPEALGPGGPGENGDADGGGNLPVGNPPAGGLNLEPPDIQARAKTPVAGVAALRADAPTIDRHGAFTDDLERFTDDCGTGLGGFQEGNKCAAGDGSGNDKTPHIGSTGKVRKEGGYVYKSANRPDGTKNKEGKVYQLMKGTPGIAAGEDIGQEIKIPEYKHIVSVDDIPEKQRKSIGPIVARNEARINRAISALSAKGVHYSDPLQFGMNPDKTFDLLDFSNSSVGHPDSALESNIDDLTNFYRSFGADRSADAVRDAYNTLKYAKSPEDAAFEDDSVREDAAHTSKQFDTYNPPTHAYYSTNPREIGINGTTQTKHRNGRKIVLSSKPISQFDIDKWELHPVIDPSTEATEKYTLPHDDIDRFRSEAPPATEGVMVSISIPPEIAESVAVTGGESPDEMHITLCYLGKLSSLDDDRIDMIRDICKSTCEYHDRFAVKLAGVGRFSASESSDDKDVIYLNVDSRWLDDLRSDLFGAMQVAGLPVSDTHGYTPHVTLKYVNKNKSFTMTHFDPLVFTAGGIRLTVGTASETFPLGPDPESDINRYICDGTIA